MRPTGRSAQRGAALILAMIAVVVVSVMATVVAAAVLGTARAARSERNREALESVAESGAEVALSRLSADRTWTGPSDEAVPGGNCQIEAKPAGPGAWEVTSRAGSGGRDCTLRMRVRMAAGKLLVTDWQTKQRALPKPTRRS